MKVEVTTNLNRVEFEHAVARLNELVNKVAPTTSDNTSVRANYDNVVEVVNGLVNFTEPEEPPLPLEEDTSWLE